MQAFPAKQSKDNSLGRAPSCPPREETHQITRKEGLMYCKGHNRSVDPQPGGKGVWWQVEVCWTESTRCGVWGVKAVGIIHRKMGRNKLDADVKIVWKWKGANFSRFKGYKLPVFRAFIRCDDILQINKHNKSNIWLNQVAWCLQPIKVKSKWKDQGLSDSFRGRSLPPARLTA